MDNLILKIDCLSNDNKRLSAENESLKADNKQMRKELDQIFKTFLECQIQIQKPNDQTMIRFRRKSK